MEKEGKAHQDIYRVTAQEANGERRERTSGCLLGNRSIIAMHLYTLINISVERGFFPAKLKMWKSSLFLMMEPKPILAICIKIPFPSLTQKFGTVFQKNWEISQLLLQIVQETDNYIYTDQIIIIDMKRILLW